VRCGTIIALGYVLFELGRVTDHYLGCIVAWVSISFLGPNFFAILRAVRVIRRPPVSRAQAIAASSDFFKGSVNPGNTGSVP
jgi:hypothetical protein